MLQNLYPHHHTLPSTNATIKATEKLKEAAKTASEIAKSKAAPIYASIQPNQS